MDEAPGAPALKQEGKGGKLTAALWSLLPSVLVAVLTLAMLHLPLNADVSWQLWIAQHLRHGARLYSDIMEVNPPLWFWMAIPIDWIATIFGSNSGPILVLGTGVAIILSMLATGRLLEKQSIRTHSILLCYIALLLMLMPLADFEQREHVALIGAIPYAALSGARRDRRVVPPALAIAIGVGAALGFALKHYFLIVPAALELWLALNLRRDWRPIRPEIVALVSVGAAYAAAMLTLTPDYFTVMIPLLRLAYGSTGAKSWISLIQPTQLVWLLSILLLVSQRRVAGTRASSLTSALLVATAGFGAAWAIQHKGWAYQAIATSGCLAAALATHFARVKSRWNVPARTMAITCLCLPLLMGLNQIRNFNSMAAVAEPAAAGLRAGDSVAFVSTEPAFAWPLTRDRGFRYPSRYYGFWMLFAIFKDQGHNPELTAFGHTVAAQTARDFTCAHPRRIAFPRDFLGKRIFLFFMRDADFAQMMARYRKVQPTEYFDVYERHAPGPDVPPNQCRRGVG